ncbi:hypothetical protein XU06_29355 (plasmid) [Rhodococcus erythropolis]|uniref:fumarylacetoacetate hydrolase family protein n=1 Tax=Rhodococcus erythropolis TaxID=1833 RepID=UPI00061B664D|nr:fumarylacetoacetate hydrolase family protein [Rhodococcus erythropolis]AKE01091.1 hypothetical protein XU06_29355 [Rhodococcus erythropolis]
MKVVLFEHPDGRRRLGVVDGDHVVDVSEWSGPLGSCPLGTFIRRSEQEAPPVDGTTIPLAEVRLLPPSLGANAVLCVGVNYADHAKLVAQRTGSPVTTTDTLPALFTKFWTSLTGHGEPIVLPAASNWLDFEGELAVIIGKDCRAVPREHALDVVAGYAVGQDGSVRDWQRKPPTPTAGKNFYHSGSLGPWMVTADEIPDPGNLTLITTVNGRTMQESSTSALIHDIPALITHITTFMPLAPGDVIFTGTPAGSFADRGNDHWLQPGDTVSVEIETVGTLTNVVAAE